MHGIVTPPFPRHSFPAVGDGLTTLAAAGPFFPVEDPITERSAFFAARGPNQIESAAAELFFTDTGPNRNESD